jgi:hypothetical protein
MTPKVDSQNALDDRRIVYPDGEYDLDFVATRFRMTRLALGAPPAVAPDAEDFEERLRAAGRKSFVLGGED